MKAELDPAALPLPGARLRTGAAVDVPRHTQAAAGDGAQSRSAARSNERRYWRVPADVDARHP